MAGHPGHTEEKEDDMNTTTLRRQFEALWQMYDAGTCMNNEWYSVGMEPPKENVSKLKAIARKLERLARQLKIEWDE